MMVGQSFQLAYCSSIPHRSSQSRPSLTFDLLAAKPITANFSVLRDAWWRMINESVMILFRLHTTVCQLELLYLHHFIIFHYHYQRIYVASLGSSMGSSWLSLSRFCSLFRRCHDGVSVLATVYLQTSDR